MAHTLTIVEPIWPMLQNLSKTLAQPYCLTVRIHVHNTTVFLCQQLKDAVCSPAGTSIQAIQVLEKAGFRGLMMEAVQTASKRASELSRIENGESQDYALKRR